MIRLEGRRKIGFFAEKMVLGSIDLFVEGSCFAMELSAGREQPSGSAQCPRFH